ncbi:Gfo/Idh/MocA family oxidoreductase [Ravibacter arvi]|uniref:Gfo/Idh/MocA family protein n=1 Tax=Ravibacter arvi TaxID=2051041 RepID=UPI0031E63700
MDQLRWGIIGCGNVTEVKSGPAFNLVPGSELVAVMRRDGALAEDYARRHGVPRWYNDADQLIDDPDVNAIYIATPPDSHLEYTRKALQAGKPVYVEKPMARNAEECAEMNRISAETGVPLYVAYYRRALPYFLKIKEIIDSKVIGEIRSVHIQLHWQPYDEEVGPDAKPRWRVFPELSGGGHFHDLASHQFDFLEFLLGPVATAKGFSANQAGLYPADDIVTATYAFESGILGTGSWCFTVNKEQRVDDAWIIGSEGKLSFHFFEAYDIIVETASGVEKYHLPYPTHVQEPFIRLMARELQEGIKACPSTGLSGARANLVMDWITGKAMSREV